MYTAIVPNIVYGILGTDRYVSYGPFPLMCLLIAEALYSAGFKVFLAATHFQCFGRRTTFSFAGGL